jgi:hypothetical protein
MGKPSSKKSGSKPAAAKPSNKPATAPATAPVKAPRKPRTPAVERAARLASQVEKKIVALTKNTGRWHGDATPEQVGARKRLAQALGSMAPLADALAVDLAFLQDSKFQPASAAPGRKPLAAGTRVKIKEKQYDAEAHGTLNLFAVLRVTEKGLYILRSVRDPRITPAVPRAWIEENGGAAPAQAEPEPDPDPENGDDADLGGDDHGDS